MDKTIDIKAKKALSGKDDPEIIRFISFVGDILKYSIGSKINEKTALEVDELVERILTKYKKQKHIPVSMADVLEKVEMLEARVAELEASQSLRWTLLFGQL